MNHQPVNAIVTSKDGIAFTVATTEAALGYEQAFASLHTAAELEQNSDFTRLDDVAAAITACEKYFTDDQSPAPLTPAQRRACFRVIKGGKS